jgi:hypothetical protein
LEPGQVVTVVTIAADSNIVETEIRHHRLLFSIDTLTQHGEMVSAA